MNCTLFSGVGPRLTRFAIDRAALTLEQRESVMLPGGIQYAWPHPSRKLLYVTSSTSVPGHAGHDHHVSAFRMSADGVLQPHGTPVRLRFRPIHNSVDRSGGYLLIAYNQPSGASVHRFSKDGQIGEEVEQSGDLDFGVFAHQILATPRNASVIVVARGNDAAGHRPEDPGSLRVFDFEDGVLRPKPPVAPDGGYGFGPRHLDFHPTRPWVYVSDERHNKLLVFRLLDDGGLSEEPLFVKDTVLDPSKHVSMAGPVHVHPNGRFVYLANRDGWTPSPPPGQEMHEGLPVFTSNESNIATFAIHEETGEPTLMQTVDPGGAHHRTFSIDPDGRLMVAGSLVPIAMRRGGKVSVAPAGLSLLRIRPDGRLEFVCKQDVDTGSLTQWWTGLIPLA